MSTAGQSTSSGTRRRADGATVEMELLRPEGWVRKLGLSVGSTFDIRLSEFTVSGAALVTAIEPCGAIHEGDGSVVTGRLVTRRADNLVRVELESGTTFVGTTTHPIWMPERQIWKTLAELEEEDIVDTLAGPLAVARSERIQRIADVYNLEVHRHHIYRITQQGVLVHNNNDCVLSSIKGVGEPVLFGQKRISERFGSDARFPKTSGRKISDVADDLREGRLSPDDLPITAFRDDKTGHLVSMNTRTRAALAEAGYEPTRVDVVDLKSMSDKDQEKYLRRLSDDLVINSPLPGYRVPVTLSRSDHRIINRADGSQYIIEISH